MGKDLGQVVRKLRHWREEPRVFEDLMKRARTFLDTLLEEPSETGGQRGEEAKKSSGRAAEDPCEPKETKRVLRGGLTLVGVRGERGAGKTSMLLSVGKAVKERKWLIPQTSRGCGEDRGDTARNDGSASEDAPAIFDPMALEPGDELLPALVAYMELVPAAGVARSRSRGCDDTDGRGGSTNESVFDKLRKPMAMKSQPDKYRDFRFEAATSASGVLEELGKVEWALSQATKELQDEFCDLLRELGVREDRPLVLLLDDTDLQPDRAFELIELLHRYLDCPCLPVLAFVAADFDTLRDAVEAHYRGNGHRRAGYRDEVARALARAYVSKRIPYGLFASMMSDKDREDFVWKNREEELGGPSLPSLLFTESLAFALEEVRLFAFLQEVAQGQRAKGEVWKPATGPREQFAAYAAPLLPRTPRGLKRVYNTTLEVFRSFEEKGWNELANRLEMPQNIAPTFVYLLASVDARTRAGKSLVALLMNEEKDLRELLSCYATCCDKAVTGDERSETTERGFSSTRADLRLVEVCASTDEEILKHIGIVFREWTTVTEEFREVTTLLLSQMADAREIWKNRTPESSTVHVELHVHGDAGWARASSQEDFRRLALQLRGQLAQKGVARQSQDALRVYARAQLPIVAWLGWYLNRRDHVFAYNVPPRSQRLVPFTNATLGVIEGSLPVGFLLDSAEDPSLVGDHVLEREQGEGSGRVLLVLDLLGGQRQVVEDVAKTFRERDDLLAARLLTVGLTARGTFNPPDLEDALRDAVHAILDLRDRYPGATIHLGMRAPDVFAFFLGQQLYARADPIVVDEFDMNSATYLPGLALADPGEPNGSTSANHGE